MIAVEVLGTLCTAKVIDYLRYLILFPCNR